MFATAQEMFEAAVRVAMRLRDRKMWYMLEPDRERQAIDMIKAIGNHVGTDEAKRILDVLRNTPLAGKV